MIPRELEGELYERLVEYYRDNPNVTVILDRRDGPDRRQGSDATDWEDRRTTRDRRRPHPGRFLDTDPPEAA